MADDLFTKELAYFKRFDSESDQPYSLNFETQQAGAGSGVVRQNIPDQFVFIVRGMTGFVQRVVAAPDLALMNDMFLTFNITWTPNNKGLFVGLTTFANVFGSPENRQPYRFDTPLVLQSVNTVAMNFTTIAGWPGAATAFGIRMFGRLIAKKAVPRGGESKK